MADNTNPTYMMDLDFCRLHLGQNQYTSTTVYSESEQETVIADLAAQGYILYMRNRVI